MAQKKRSAMGRSPARAANERDALGRLQTDLDEALLEKLCATFRDGDFRNATALRCGVHPKTLTRWLRRGAADENAGLFTRLFVEFGRIEGDLRAHDIAEVRNPEASREEAVGNDEGTVTTVKTTRRVSGVQWYMERRFRQFRADWVPREDETEVGEFLVQQQQGFSAEAAAQVARAMALSMPPELQAPFLTWARARLPAGVTIDGNDDEG